MRRMDERGSVAVLAAFISMALIGSAAFVIDLGVQRVARADMQALADVVALDLGRELDGSLDGQLDDVIPQRADESRDRQVVERAGGAADQASIGERPTVTPVLGTLDSAGVFTPTADDEVPDAVRVTATTDVDFAFGLLTSGAATRSAIGTGTGGGPGAVPPSACMKLGSSALDLQSGNSALLGSLLGDAVGLSVLDTEGLADLGVQLADLALALGAGSVDELLATEVTAGEFAAAVVEAASNDDDDANDATASILTTSVLGAINSDADAEEFTVGEILALGPGGDAALQATVDVLSLVRAAIFAANGDQALGLDLSLPTGFTAALRITEPPVIACGNAVARTAQLQLEIVQQQRIPLVADVTLRTTLDLAEAEGKVASGPRCVDGVPVEISATLLRSTLIDLVTTVDVKLLSLIPVTSATIPSVTPVAGGTGTYPLELPLRYDTPFPTPQGSGTLGVPDVTRAQLSALGLNLGGLLSGALSITGAVNTLANTLETQVNTVIAPFLGLRIATADLYAVRTPQCAAVRLAG